MIYKSVFGIYLLFLKYKSSALILTGLATVELQTGACCLQGHLPPEMFTSYANEMPLGSTGLSNVTFILVEDVLAMLRLPRFPRGGDPILWKL